MSFGFRVSASLKRGGFALAKDAFSTLMKIEEEAYRNGATNAARVIANGAKDELRADVKSAGLGNRLAFTWQGKVYPEKKTSVDAAAFVYSKAPLIKRVHTRGAVIRAYNSRYFLAIPTKETDKLLGISGRAKVERITPYLFEETTGIELTPRPSKKGGMVLTGSPSDRYQNLIDDRLSRRGRRKYRTRSAQRGGKNSKETVYFILVRQVTLQPRLNSDRIGQKWARQAPNILAKEHAKARAAANQTVK